MTAIITIILMNAGSQRVVDIKNANNLDEVKKAVTNPNGIITVIKDARNSVVNLEKPPIPDGA